MNAVKYTYLYRNRIVLLMLLCLCFQSLCWMLQDVVSSGASVAATPTLLSALLPHRGDWAKVLHRGNTWRYHGERVLSHPLTYVIIGFVFFVMTSSNFLYLSDGIYRTGTSQIWLSLNLVFLSSYQYFTHNLFGLIPVKIHFLFSALS